MPLVNLADLAAYLRRDFSPEDGYTAQLLLNGAADLVTTYCGWHIAPSVTETAIVDGSGTTLLALPSLHVTDVSAVVELGNAQDITSIEWSTYGVLEKRGGARWTARRRAVTVTYTHGLDAVPDWLTTLICAVAARAFIGVPGVSLEAGGSEQVRFTADAGMIALGPVEKSMLNRLAVNGAGM